MNSGDITATKAIGVVRFDDQHKFQVDVGYVAAGQNSIYLAMVIHERLYGIGNRTIANGCGLME
jgi:hypothetical protein